MFSPAVKAEQTRLGSRAMFEDREWKTEITDDLRQFLAVIDTFFFATASADGRPYIQHRGGPPGFLKPIGTHMLAFADFAGNRQYITLGHLKENDRAHIFILHFATRQRVKLWGRARVVEGDLELMERLVDPAYKARPERAIAFRLEAWDANCPQHIVPRYSEAEIAPAVDRLAQRIKELEEEVARLEGRKCLGTVLASLGSDEGSRNMTKPKAIALNRRTILAAAGAATAALAAPRILRAQGKELVVGGAASHKTFVETVIAPVVEKKYACKIVFEGTRSLVNLEKMQKNKDKQYLSVVMMDDPVMIPAVAEGLLDPLTPAKVPNLAALKPGTIHMDGMWCNYLQPWLGIAYNPKVAARRRRPRGATSTTPSTRAASSCRRCRTPRASPTCSWRPSSPPASRWPRRRRTSTPASRSW